MTLSNEDCVLWSTCADLEFHSYTCIWCTTFKNVRTDKLLNNLNSQPIQFQGLCTAALCTFLHTLTKKIICCDQKILSPRSWCTWSMPTPHCFRTKLTVPLNVHKYVIQYGAPARKINEEINIHGKATIPSCSISAQWPRNRQQSKQGMDSLPCMRMRPSNVRLQNTHRTLSHTRDRGLRSVASKSLCTKDKKTSRLCKLRPGSANSQTSIGSELFFSKNQFEPKESVWKKRRTRTARVLDMAPPSLFRPSSWAANFLGKRRVFERPKRILLWIWPIAAY